MLTKHKKNTGQCRTNNHPKTFPDQLMVYEIKTRSHPLTGRVINQATLHGLLKKVRDLGMPLLSVNCLEPGLADGLAINETHQKLFKQE